ncbi:DUF7226 domain-containing protein [Methanobrevibacter curvatus]|uniref:Type-2 restriction enzyme DpnI n=1 Tax=Methanobrevibacter curvatus TaxID=49547 RepID=A0A166B3H6_9EURY|nr:hypothetical protein [Methanobrevibacter curvatus]KZX12818.1 type-2 restriction enzyme DpnI [Methanobrevibacter curvatus]
MSDKEDCEKLIELMKLSDDSKEYECVFENGHYFIRELSFSEVQSKIKEKEPKIDLSLKTKFCIWYEKIAPLNHKNWFKNDAEFKITEVNNKYKSSFYHDLFEFDLNNINNEIDIINQNLRNRIATIDKSFLNYTRMTGGIAKEIIIYYLDFLKNKKYEELDEINNTSDDEIANIDKKDEEKYYSINDHNKIQININSEISQIKKAFYNNKSLNEPFYIFLEEFFDSITIIHDENSIPQANDFDKIVKLCENIKERSMTDETIKEAFSFGFRQVKYYVGAAIYLNLIKISNNYLSKSEKYVLSENGKEIFNLEKNIRDLYLSKLILQHPIFNKTMEYYVKHNTIPKNYIIMNFMKELNIILSEITLLRRSSTVSQWINWILETNKLNYSFDEKEDIQNDAQIILTDFDKDVDKIEPKENDINLHLHLKTKENSLYGWKKTIFRKINELNQETFTLNDLYESKSDFQNKYPNNSKIEPKIRQTLQQLRDLGLIEFIGNGNYKLTFYENNILEKEESIEKDLNKTLIEEKNYNQLNLTKIKNRFNYIELSDKIAFKIYNLKKENILTPARVRSIKTFLSELKEISQNLNLKTEYNDLILSFYLELIELESTRGRSIQEILIALINIVNKLNSDPVYLNELSDVSQIDKNLISKTSKELAKILNINIPLTKSTDYLPRIIKKLELSEEIKIKTENLINSLDKNEISGKNPYVLAMVCLFYALKESNINITQEEFSKLVNISVITIRKNYNDLKIRLNQLSDFYSNNEVYDNNFRESDNELLQNKNIESINKDTDLKENHNYNVDKKIQKVDDSLIEDKKLSKIPTDNLITGEKEEKIAKTYKFIEEKHTVSKSNKIVSFKFLDEEYNTSHSKKLLTILLAILYEKHSVDFYKISNLHGRNKPYFSRSPQELIAGKLILGTDIYVETNRGTNDIIRFSYKIINLFGYSKEDLEIFQEDDINLVQNENISIETNNNSINSNNERTDNLKNEEKLNKNHEDFNVIRKPKESVYGFKFLNDIYKTRFSRDLFIKLSTILYEKHEPEFNKVLEFHGRSNPYFSKDPEPLRSPKLISGTDIYLDSHGSTKYLINKSYKLLDLFGYSKNDLEIYRESDKDLFEEDLNNKGNSLKINNEKHLNDFEDDFNLFQINRENIGEISDEEILRKIAENHVEVLIRILALEKISNQTFLKEIAENNNNNILGLMAKRKLIN